MEIVDSRQVFDDIFNSYLNGDKNNYLNKLLEYTIRTEPDLVESILARIKDLQEELLNDVMDSETEEDYDFDIEDTRREKMEFILYCMNNYMASISPADAVSKFMNDNLKSLINESKLYTNKLISELANKMSYIKKTTEIESSNNVLYSNSLDSLSNYLTYRDGFSLVYSPMKTDIFNATKETPIQMIKEIVDAFLIETSIITKFDINARKYASTTLNKSFKQNDDNDEPMNMNNVAGNICESLLMNYSLLSIYSNEPEKIKISDQMLNSIMMEVENGTITKEDIIDFIENGTIKFSEEEITYIKDTFVKRIFYREDKKSIEKQDLLKLVK